MSRKQADLLFSLGMLILVVGMVWLARDWPVKSRLFPLTIGIPAATLALLQVGFAIRRLRATAAIETESSPPKAAERPSATSTVHEGVEAAVEEMLAATEASVSAAELRVRAIEICTWLFLFVLGAALLGFRLGAGVLALGFLRITAHEPWRLAIPIAFGAYLMFALFFDYWLAVHLPAGLIADWLGMPSLDVYLIGRITGH